MIRPVRSSVHPPDEIDRNLLRLAAYAHLVLETPPLPTPAGFLWDPTCCARQLVSASSALFVRLERPCLDPSAQPPVADHLAFLFALLSRVAYSSLPPAEALGRLRLEIQESLRGDRPDPRVLDRFYPRLRRRLLDLLHHLRGDPRGERALPPCVDIAKRLYNLGDALGFFTLLAPPRSAPPCRTSTRSPPTSRPRRTPTA